ncbi:TPA: hypothetical protein I7766_04080 [Vibrio vulnificus]|nr:hypothetical protein [Vibrio vulnificus]
MYFHLGVLQLMILCSLVLYGRALVIPFRLEAAAVLATLGHWHASPAQSHSLSMFMGMTSLAAYLQLQVVWV